VKAACGLVSRLVLSTLMLTLVKDKNDDNGTKFSAQFGFNILNILKFNWNF